MTDAPALDGNESRDRLARLIAAALGRASARITRLDKLSGGAIQENWALDVRFDPEPPLALVMRTDAPSGVAVSHGRQQEYLILKAAFDAGVMAPEPLASCNNPSVIGKPFYLMRRLRGTAAGHVIVRDDKWKGDRKELVEKLGRQLATLHTIKPPRDDLGFLTVPEGPPALAAIAVYRGWLDSQVEKRPGLEWGLRWLERHAPPRGEIVLCHRDYRTGNYMVDESGLTGILDWEFAGWGDPLEDVGWFCAKCWRFGQVKREAGGIGARADFYRAYSKASGRDIDADAVRYWEIMAHARWAVIALQQGARHASGAERSLDLALTGRRAADIELELLRLTAPPELAARSAPPKGTDGIDLLDTARETLIKELLPGLAEDKRLTALMIANAMGIASREGALADDALRDARQGLAEHYGLETPAPRGRSALLRELADLNRRLAAEIRLGGYDHASPARDRVLGLLLASAEAQTWVNNPKYLDL